MYRNLYHGIGFEGMMGLWRTSKAWHCVVRLKEMSEEDIGEMMPQLQWRP